MMHRGEELEFERRLDRALESAPEVQVPEDFAMRVAALAPKRRVAMRADAPRRSVGDVIAWVVAAMLLVAMFAFAPSAVAGGAKSWVEFALAMYFVALTLWLGLRLMIAAR